MSDSTRGRAGFSEPGAGPQKRQAAGIVGEGSCSRAGAADVMIGIPHKHHAASHLVPVGIRSSVSPSSVEMSTAVAMAMHMD
jgi:hypothetical protein